MLYTIECEINKTAKFWPVGIICTLYCKVNEIITRFFSLCCLSFRFYFGARCCTVVGRLLAIYWLIVFCLGIAENKISTYCRTHAHIEIYRVAPSQWCTIWCVFCIRNYWGVWKVIQFRLVFLFCFGVVAFFCTHLPLFLLCVYCAERIPKMAVT